MAKTITLRLKDDVYEIFRRAAQAENRSLSNLIETNAYLRIVEQQFTDDVEMAEILADERLMKRIAAGRRDAAEGRGHFVE